MQLTRTEYAILKLLMQNPGQVLAKSVLLDRISADTPDCTESSLKTHIGNRDGPSTLRTGLSESSLKTHIGNLRGKLRQASGHDYVEAVGGIGFRLKTES